MDTFLNDESSMEVILKSFDDKCKKENIWYSLSNISLLDAESDKNFSNENIIEVMMTVDSYKKFLKFYAENIVDTITRSNYYFSNPFFIEKSIKCAIKINLLIEASATKTEKFYSIKNLIRQKIGFYKTIGNVKGFKNLIKSSFFRFLGLFLSPLTWQEISSNISSDKYNGYFMVDKFSSNINKNWIHSLTKITKKTKWKNVETRVINESNDFLIKKYGFDWLSDPDVKNDIDYFDLVKKFI